MEETAVIPSTEVHDLTRRAYEVLTTGEGDVGSLFAEDDDVIAIGSDPDEWWMGHDRITAALRAQGEALRGSRVEGSDPAAYAVGDVGWVADRPTIVMPDGTSVAFRVTATAVRSGGSWKFVQWHGSVPVSNVDVLGRELPI
jgi:hypothetical protein